MGRPTDFTKDIADQICERLSEGDSLRTICGEEWSPGKSTVFRWLAENKEFRDQYARAREQQAELYAAELVDIADENPKDAAGVQRNRLRVDTRKWVASKLLPKKYGDNASLALTGAEGGPIQAAITVEFVKPKREEI